MDDIDKLRSIKIHKLLAVKEDGRRVKMKCPVHNEKLPSFMLYPDGSYYCFGCTAHGSNSIDFLMDLGASFQEAITELKTYI